MFGYSATGSCTIATTPRITMRMEITMATTGRLMKNFATAGLPGGAGPGRRARFHLHLLARAHPVASLDDHPLTWFESLCNDRDRSDLHVDLHGTHVDGLVPPDHRDLVNTLHVLDGPLRDQERVLLHLDHGPDLSVLTGAQQVPRIGKDASGQHGAGGHIDLSV